MADPILIFPRVIVQSFNPTVNDNIDAGYIEGNMWINVNTGKIYTCVNKFEGKWVELVVTGSASGGDIVFDIDPGYFIVDALNVKLNQQGNLDLTGENLTINTDAVSPPTDMCYFNIFRGGEPEYQNASISWNEVDNRWESGIQPNLHPVVTAVIETRDPEETDYDGYFVGQTWINLVTQQKFTCVSRLGGTATWRLALTSAPTKMIIEGDDHIILYGIDDQTFTKIHWDTLVEWIRYRLGIDLTPAPEGYGWQQDELASVMPSEEDPITNGLFEQDGNGDLIPTETPFNDASDTQFELDAFDDIMIQDADLTGGGTGGDTGGGEPVSADPITSNASLSSGGKYLVDGGLTVSLPPAPNPGDIITLLPGTDWSLDPLTVTRSGNNIMGSPEDLTCDVRVEFLLVFKDLTEGWLVMN